MNKSEMKGEERLKVLLEIITYFSLLTQKVKTESDAKERVVTNLF